jgi:glycosyltransferase involved in cell wall biosynthesis
VLIAIGARAESPALRKRPQWKGKLLKIAILGTRGIPANYGGFETFAEECSAGLAARGHQVTVYCRSHYVPKDLKTHRGARLIVLPTLKWKYSDTVIHTLFSVLHSLFQQYDAILICNAANSIFAWMPRVLGIPVVVNVDGIERLRQKWNWIGKSYYRICEQLSTLFPNRIITDAKVIQRYYREHYGADSEFIPYGAIMERTEGHEFLEKFGLSPREYFLYVSRLEPENNAHIVIKAFEKAQTSKRLVILGDAPYSVEYIRRLRETTDTRIIFAGAIYGSGYRQLLGNAFCYIHATEVGGTHPALIEAMGQGNIVIANGVDENIEVLDSAGIIYKKNDAHDLSRCIQAVADRPEYFAEMASTAFRRAQAYYSWDSVIQKYEQLFQSMVKR